MILERVEIAQYRSLRDLALPLGTVTVLLGGNGSGKTNCYRAIRLLHAAALGRLSAAFAEEGGMPSALWSGRRSRGEAVRLRVTIIARPFSFALACGLPRPPDPGAPPSLFALDPEVKEEDLTARLPGRSAPVTLVERRQRQVVVWGEDGRRTTVSAQVDRGESVLAQVSDPARYPELALLRETLSGWRFYHQFRTDPESPLRDERVGIWSPVLAGDGANLAAALATIDEIGHGDELRAAIAEALPGARLEITTDAAGRLGLLLHQDDAPRPFSGRELSDGTLRFLCLAAALLTPRLPGFLVLNEPETSLHGDLLPALAGLISRAGARCQVLVTTHSTALAAALATVPGGSVHRLTRRDGETVIADG